MADDKFELFLKKLGEIVKRERKQKGLTQGELGQLIGKPQSTVARLESTIVKDTHLSLIFQLCEALELDLSSVLAEALGRSFVTRKAQKKINLEQRLEGLMDRISLLEKAEKEHFALILEEVFKLID